MAQASVAAIRDKFHRLSPLFLKWFKFFNIPEDKYIIYNIEDLRDSFLGFWNFLDHFGLLEYMSFESLEKW